MIMPGEDSTKAVRAVFVIDPDGMIRTVIYYPLSLGRNFDELLRVVKALQTADALRGRHARRLAPRRSRHRAPRRARAAPPRTEWPTPRKASSAKTGSSAPRKSAQTTSRTPSAASSA